MLATYPYCELSRQQLSFSLIRYLALLVNNFCNFLTELSYNYIFASFCFHKPVAFEKMINSFVLLVEDVCA